MWRLEQIPAEFCKGELSGYGIYRVVNCTDSARARGLCPGNNTTYDEFVPYCDKAVKKYGAWHEVDIKKWVKLLTDK